ncbi:MAG TPA: OmpA family protein [Saprospiraceae bacterium]|nr:OmpA family protein [Saprospiraceae bacterium]
MRALFWLIIFLVYLVGARWYFVCEVRQLCDADTGVDDFRLKTLQFRDGETIVLSGYDHFRFDSARVQPVINDNNFKYLSQVGAYLKDNPERALTITGALGTNESEVQRGFYDNLGIARADAIRSMFVEMGIPQDRITLDYMIDSSNLLRRPALFAAIDTTDEKGAFTFTHMTFSDANFEYNSAVFNPGPAFQSYADSVKIYFEQVDTLDLAIIGHTDSIASQTYNNRLGQARADSARIYFLNLGLSPERILTRTRGEDEPVAPNSTEEGRQKNRRVEIVIQ